MSVIRTVFMGTPEIARFCLAALYEDDHFEIVGVVTQPDRPAGRKMKLTPSAVKAWAIEKNLPVITPAKVSEDSVVEQIQSWKAEVCVVVAFGQLLKKNLLDLFPNRIVNVHASLLPRWRGAAPIQRAIEAGDKETGVSLQVMKLELDAGDVIGKRKITILPEWSGLDLLKALMPLSADLLKVDFMDYLRGNLSAEPQDPSQVTYAKKLLKSESELDWSLTAEQIHNKVRAFQMGPGTFTWIHGKKVKIHKTECVHLSKATNQPAGTIIELDENGLVIQCGKGQIKILELQPESRARMPAAHFLQGHPLTQGEEIGVSISRP